MFCLIYQFEIKPGTERRFRQGWQKVTEKLIECNGSLGARLHQDSDGNWISYAQWPDEETWQQGEQAIHDWLQHSHHWADCLSGSVKLIRKMAMTDDLLKEPATAEPTAG